MQEIWSVSQLTAKIKKQLESQFQVCSVRGEISNLKRQSSGHFYFTLKDEQSQISSVLFQGNTHTLKQLPKEGDQVIAHGEISVYAPRGNYQLIVRSLEYLGIGQLLLKLHELKKKLEARGWFAPELKKKLPKHPKTIGVVTSPTGSVIQDILNVLNRRFSGFHLILNPVKVQGELAAVEIAKAIDEFNKYNLASVLIVGRGGGSLEDLWAFNEEIVAEAIFRSQIPVISAVGHETDVSISDYVADVRAPTPSAAAEIAVAEKAAQLRFLKQTQETLTHSVTTQIAHHKKILIRFDRSPCMRSSYPLLGQHLQKLDEFKTSLDRQIFHILQKNQLKTQALIKQASTLKPSNQLLSIKEKFSSMHRALNYSITRQISSCKHLFDADAVYKLLLQRCRKTLFEKKQNLERLISHLKSIDPKNILTKGYCILFQEKPHSVILSAEELSPNQTVSILMHDGKAKARIQEVTP